MWQKGTHKGMHSNTVSSLTSTRANQITLDKDGLEHSQILYRRNSKFLELEGHASQIPPFPGTKLKILVGLSKISLKARTQIF